MRNFRSYLLVLLMMKLSSIPLLSCQRITVDNHYKNDNVDSTRVTLLNIDKSHVLDLEKLSIVFPKQLGGLSRTGIKLDKIVGSATAFYGYNKYEISIIDDLRNSFSNILLFNRNYRKLNESEVERTIKTVRDGYKTITTIENAETTSISFVFKKRYLFKVTGTNKQTPYMVWRFLELNKFHDLVE